uniref:Uncharacterized protein n=1 Tax=Neobodo designis TaxID=312471 RepID=A0A7S1LJB8_NEODS
MRPQAAMLRSMPSTPSIFDAGASRYSTSAAGNLIPYAPAPPRDPPFVRPGAAGSRRFLLSSVRDDGTCGLQRQQPDAAVDDSPFFATFEEFPEETPSQSLPGNGSQQALTSPDTFCSGAMRSPHFSHSIPLGVMPSAAADEGWRRVLHGMLQRDPRRRTKVSELRKQLAALEATC